MLSNKSSVINTVTICKSGTLNKTIIQAAYKWLKKPALSKTENNNSATQRLNLSALLEVIWQIRNGVNPPSKLMAKSP